MATVNSRFLAIGSGEPNISAGWTIWVHDYKDMTSQVAVAHQFTAFSFTQELNGPGTGSITFDEDSPFWTAILNNGHSNRTLMDNEYVFEAWDNGVPRFAWLGTTVSNTLAGDDETRTVTISGPGIAAVLKWAKVGRPGWPTKVPVTGKSPSTASPTGYIDVYRASSSSDTLPAYNWEFTPDWPSMRMWFTVFKAAQRRGLLPWVTAMFDAAKDSAKQPWIWIKTIENVTTTKDPITGKVHTYGFQPENRNQTLLEFLGDCTGQEYSKWFGQRLEWMMYPGFKLDVRRHIGTDRSKTVRFFQGNIISDERTRDREEIANRVVAMDTIGNESVRTDNASIAKWNLRERWDETNKQVTVDSLRNQVADRYIQQSKDEKDQWTIRVPYDDPSRVPYRNFSVGDDIGISVAFLGGTPSAVNEPVKMRVMAITISLSADQTVPDCELTLKSLIDSRMDELTKQVTELLNNPKNIDIGDVKQISPSAANAKDGDTLVWNAKTGQWEPGTPTSTGGGGGGSGSGSIYIQKTDPALATGAVINPGDLWLETYD